MWGGGGGRRRILEPHSSPTQGLGLIGSRVCGEGFGFFKPFKPACGAS